MRPPPFQPPTQGLPRLPRADLAPAGSLINGAGAGPRIPDANTPGLESVAPPTGDVRHPEADRGDSRTGKQNPAPKRSGGASASPRRTPARG